MADQGALPRLIVVSERDHRFIDLDGKECGVGRAPENMIVVKDDMVSRRHCVIERAGAVKVWSPATKATSLLGRVPVATSDEDGLLGLALDPDFADNRRLYLYYSAPGTNEQHLSRFTQGVMRGPSPLPPWQRELIAAFTSKLNQCLF